MPRARLVLAEWALCMWTRLRGRLERRCSSTEELLARRERLVRAFALHAGGSGGPAVMGIGAGLREVEHELRRRGIAVDTDEWMKYTGRGR